MLAVLRDVLAGMVAAAAPRRLRSRAPAPTLPVVPDEIPVIHFADALALVGAPADEPDLAPEHERALGAWALAEHGSDFLAVEGYPMAKRPFYTHPQPDRPALESNSFDLLFRGLELVTGGQRLHRPSDYERAIRARGEDPAAYDGVPPGVPARDAAARRLRHRAGALGRPGWSEAANIREVTLFPRDLTPAELP